MGHERKTNTGVGLQRGQRVAGVREMRVKENILKHILSKNAIMISDTLYANVFF